MITTNSTNSIDIEGLANNVMNDLSDGDINDKKVIKACIQSERNALKTKRAERIKNLEEQLRGVAGGGGKCIKILKPIAKVLDFISKPLSLLSLGKLDIGLGSALKNIEEAKKQGKLTGLKIDEQGIMRAIEGVKKYLTDNVASLDSQEQSVQQQVNTILKMLDDIGNSVHQVGNV
ncbi:MAG TPA: hypothetical protein VJC18_04840 [bacterium]|nr:hypothetical protein [bacterium]